MGRRAAVAAALALALVPGGCGGGDDGSLSASALRTRATTICDDTAVAMELVPTPSGPDEAARFLRSGAAQLRPALAGLQRLRAPEPLRARYVQALRLGGEELALIAAAAHAAAAHREDATAAVRRLQRRLEELTRDEDATWRALEIPSCVKR